MWFHDSDDIYYSCKAEGVGLGYAGAAPHDGGKAIDGAGGSSVGLGVGGDASVHGPAFMLVLGKVLPYGRVLSEVDSQVNCMRRQVLFCAVSVNTIDRGWPLANRLRCGLRRLCIGPGRRYRRRLLW